MHSPSMRHDFARQRSDGRRDGGRVAGEVIAEPRYSYQDAGGIIEELDPEWGSYCHPPPVHAGEAVILLFSKLE